MDLKDKYLDRIADALEEQMGVSPKLIGGNVLKPNIYRIADALDPEPTPLKDGTLKNPLARIAEVIESGQFGGGGKIKVIEGTEVPSNSFGDNYQFYAYDNKLFVKADNIWTYIGLYNPDLPPYIPDGVTVDRNYYISSKIGDYVKNLSYATVQRNTDGKKSIIVYTARYDLTNLVDESLDEVYDSSKIYKALWLFRNPEDVYIKLNTKNKELDLPIIEVIVYEHNKYIGSLYCRKEPGSGYGGSEAGSGVEIYITPEGSVVPIKQSVQVTNNITRLMAPSDNGPFYIRVVDDTIIRALHAYIL